MTTWEGEFLRRPMLWAVPLGLLLFSAAGLGLYRANFAGESVGLERRLADREKQLREVAAERQNVENLLRRAELNQRQIDEVYEQRFSTRRARLTAVATEVKDLARRAGLEPLSISYPEEPIEEFGVLERQIQLPLTGTYDELRSFVNLLELSPSFLILRRLDVDGVEGTNEVDLRLELSTLFTADKAEEPARPQT